MRLIDADALLKGKDDHQIISTHLIWNAPTVDAVAVVRCGECAIRDKWGCPWWKDEARPDDWYCADGERKDDGDNR